MKNPYRWTPTSRANPKKSGDYIATVHQKCVFGERSYTDIVNYDTRYGWHLSSGSNVTAWHTKPEPYRENSRKAGMD